MALIKAKLRFGKGFGLNLSEKGISPYVTTPLGPVDAGLTTFPSGIKGIRFSIGKNPAYFLMALAKQMGRPPQPAKPKPRIPKPIRPK
jgi:hypothetical protein